MAPSQILDMETMNALPGPSGPTPISITFNLVKLNDLDQSSFAFEVEFDLMVSWGTHREEGSNPPGLRKSGAPARKSVL